jgi:hypothetical protein
MRRLKFSGAPVGRRFRLRHLEMLFGHNSNVTVNGMVIHVQTEDRGMHSAMIDTTVYYRGRVLHRRTQSYSDLLPLDTDREQALRLRVDDQHATVMQELRSGALAVPAPPPPAPLAAPPPPPPTPAKVLSVDLLNPRTWLEGKHATLYLVVRDKHDGVVATGARVTARVHGAAEHTEVSATTNADGHVHLQFEMPRLVAEDAALVIEAVAGGARGQLRFQLRAKPKVPAAG